MGHLRTQSHKWEKPPLTSTHGVRVYPANVPLTQPPISPPKWGLGACAVRERSRVGMRPRPLSHKWEGVTVQRVPEKATGMGVSTVGIIPRPWLLRVQGPRPRSHPPAHGFQPWDRWQWRRPCPALGSVCKVSRREAPTHQ